MRIIGGKYKGQRFHPPKNIPTRPTTDIAKEGLFNTIYNYYNFDNIRFLDLFGGTGSITYEFLSRGCLDTTTVERFPKCVNFIQKTLDQIQGEAKCKLLKMDVFEFISNANEEWDVIFAGPPYGMDLLDTLPDLILENEMIEGEGWFILEHNPNHDFKNHPNLWKARNYGSTIFSIFTNKEHS